LSATGWDSPEDGSCHKEGQRKKKESFHREKWVQEFKGSRVQKFKSSKVQGLFALLHEYEIDCGDEAEECSCVIPMQAFVLEHYVGKEGEDYE
jgi:hypothetical protein